MALKWPKIDSRVELDTTIKRAMHLKTYYKSVKNYYDKYKQTLVNLKTLLSLVDNVQKLCFDVFKLWYNKRLDQVVNTVKEARDIIDYVKCIIAI